LLQLDRSPSTRGKPSANCVRTEMPLFAASLRVSAITSRMASLISTSFRAGAFLMSARTLPTTSPARFPSLTIERALQSTSRRFGGLALRKRRAANAYVTAAVSLVHFMGDRGRQLAHRRDAVGVCKLQLRFGQWIHCGAAGLRPSWLHRYQQTGRTTDDASLRSRRGSPRAWCQRNSPSARRTCTTWKVVPV